MPIAAVFRAIYGHVILLAYSSDAESSIMERECPNGISTQFAPTYQGLPLVGAAGGTASGWLPAFSGGDQTMALHPEPTSVALNSSPRSGRSDL